MLRFFTTAGLVLALSQAALAQSSPAPHAMGSHGHMMAGDHMTSKKHPKAGSIMSHHGSLMHGNQMHGVTPKRASPSHSP